VFSCQSPLFPQAVAEPETRGLAAGQRSDMANIDEFSRIWTHSRWMTTRPHRPSLAAMDRRSGIGKTLRTQ
jgi:hypothetical protein